MTRYVAGFLFSEDCSEVVLIRKNKGPSNMAGFLNAVGGKIEDDDIDENFAMFREFLEETGLSTYPAVWQVFHTETFNDTDHVTFFVAKSKHHHKVCSLTSEEVFVLPVQEVIGKVDELKVFHNVPYLINKALGFF